VKYTTIGEIKDILSEFHKQDGSRMNFMDALRELEKRGAFSSEAPVKRSVSFKKSRTLSFRDFSSYILKSPVNAEIILSNKDKTTIAESIVIPHGRDVYSFVHLPFVNDGMHSHNFFEVNYIYKGHCTQITKDERRELNEGDFCIISPFTSHLITVSDEESFVISILLRKSTFDAIFGYLMAQDDLLATFFKNTLYETDQSNYILFHTENSEDIRALIQHIVIESSGDLSYGSLCCNSYMQVLFCTLLREYSKTILYYGYSGEKNPDIDFTMVLQYINMHYRDVTLKVLAEFFHYSESYMSRMIRVKMKTGFSALLQNIRLRHASEFLINSNMTITEITSLVGLESTDYFTRSFKKHFGCTPSEYRKKFR